MARLGDYVLVVTLPYTYPKKANTYSNKAYVGWKKKNKKQEIQKANEELKKAKEEIENFADNLANFLSLSHRKAPHRAFHDEAIFFSCPLNGNKELKEPLNDSLEQLKPIHSDIRLVCCKANPTYSIWTNWISDDCWGNLEAWALSRPNFRTCLALTPYWCEK